MVVNITITLAHKQRYKNLRDKGSNQFKDIWRAKKEVITPWWPLVGKTNTQQHKPNNLVK